MTEELEWTFPSVPKCEEKGLNDSGVEMFRGDTIVSLAREICQNSLDAAIRPAFGQAREWTFYNTPSLCGVSVNQSLLRWIFPLMVLGSSSRNTTMRGYL